MGFSIGYDFGPLGWLIVALLAAVAVIALLFLLSAAKMARDDVVDEEHDRGNNDVPLA